MADTDDFDLGAWAKQRQEAAERAAGVKPPTPTAPTTPPGQPPPTGGAPLAAPMTSGQSTLLRGTELFSGQVLPGAIHSINDPINLLYGVARGRGEPVPGLEPERTETLVPPGWQPSQEPTTAGLGERLIAAGGRGFGEGVPYGAAAGLIGGTVLGGPIGAPVGAGAGALIGGGVGALSAVGAEATHELFPQSQWAPQAVGTALSMVNPIQAIRGIAQHAIPAAAALVGYHTEGLVGAAVGWLGTHGITQVFSPGGPSRLWRAPIGFQTGQERANQPAAQLPPNLLTPAPGF